MAVDAVVAAVADGRFRSAGLGAAFAELVTTGAITAGLVAFGPLGVQRATGAGRAGSMNA